MASSSFDFDDLVPVVAEVAATTSQSSVLPRGELLDFDSFVEVSPSLLTDTGGVDGVIGKAEDIVSSNDLGSIEDGNENVVGILKMTSNELRSVCRGIVGRSNGARFCTRMRCNVSSHSGNKVALNSNEGRYFIQGPRGNQALTEPSIPIDWVMNESDRRVLETAKKSTAVWRLFFNV